MAAVKAGIVPPSLAGDMPPAPPVVKRTPDVSSSPSAVGNSSQAGRVDGKKAGAGIDLEDLPDEIDEETIKQILDQADEVHVEILSESNLKRCVAQLEKRIKKNQQDRIRYAEDPEKWIKSEVDLDEEIKRWKNLAADPSLYPLFIETRGLELLLSLLNHSNQDIQLEVFDVLTELTDTDTISECEKPQEILNKLVEHQVPELTVEGLLRINEDAGEDEHRGVSHCLSIIENLLELDPSLSTKFSKLPRFASWLLRRIRTSPLGGQTAPTAAGGGGAVSSSFDFNRVYASELLVIILQNSHEARETLGMKQSGDAVDKILRAVASYRKRDPESSQEEEMIQNLFDALCSLLLVRSNQELLGRQQGIELMLRIIKERRFFYSQALKVLDFALLKCDVNCQVFVEKLGLKFLFSIYMRKSPPTLQKRKRTKAQDRQDEEHAVSIINSLCRACCGASSSGVVGGNTAARVLNKFMENQCEKIERLLELHDSYQNRVEKFYAKEDERRQAQAARDEELFVTEVEIDREERLYLDACDRGLFVLQQVDGIIVRLANMGNALVTKRLIDLLHMKSIDSKQIRKVISDYAKHLDESAQEERESLLKLLDQFEEIYNNGGVLASPDDDEEEEEEEEDEEEEEKKKRRKKVDGDRRGDEDDEKSEEDSEDERRRRGRRAKTESSKSSRGDHRREFSYSRREESDRKRHRSSG